MVRIWFNHWFSTVYQVIRLVREGETDLHIIGSNEHEQAVYSLVCDEFYREPALHGDAYVDFCLDFCRAHDVDIFCPRRGMLDISNRRAEFEALGVKLMADDYDKIAVLNQKAEAYELFRRLGIGTVPPYYTVTDVQGFRAAYEALSREFSQISFKFVRDEGGKSFRLIDNTRTGYAALFKKQTTRMTYDDAVAALSERESFPPVMVMPYLPNEEISVDCLKTAAGIIMLPRVKDATRVERLRYDEEILSTCADFYEKYGLEHPCNIQFKYLHGKPYFLEINTRMSGGVQMACAASGVNLPNIAVNRLRGIEKPWHDERRNVAVTQIETPVVFL